MRLNSPETFVNKQQYDDKVDIREKEPFLNAKFEAELEKKCSSEIADFIKKDRFVKDSLLMLFDHHEKTFNHTIEVGNIAAFITDNTHETVVREESDDLIAAALLHDYGKLAVETELLDKHGPITSEEREALKQHVSFSYETVNQINELWGKIVVAHHEFQADAYPRKQSADMENEMREPNEKVKRLSRVLAMIDVYEAMVDDRPGNPAKSIKQINVELGKQFSQADDQDIIFLLKQYFMAKNPDQEIDAVFN